MKQGQDPQCADHLDRAFRQMPTVCGSTPLFYPSSASIAPKNISGGPHRIETRFTHHTHAIESRSECESARTLSFFHHSPDAALDGPQAHAQLSANRDIGYSVAHESEYVDVKVVGAGVRVGGLIV
ncbi:hypothetical protein ABZY19_28990 [Streptomyces sp. NPDC006475]|uniref:hypothetical protein n=1 Tax=Streptomyces sp. NPDC006475 TaxID=3155719 RepID=UPI0033AF5E2C